jgi:hypothetical protein
MKKEFNLKEDGWDFKNWKEGNWGTQDGNYCTGAPETDGYCALAATGPHSNACEFSWKLYEEAYIAVNELNTFDQLFYDKAFKKVAENGNCGGMSFLALALYKYGGYMGFCSPASFYEGIQIYDAKGKPLKKEAPLEPALHHAINILQARQFASRNIIRIIELGPGNRCDAELAWKTVSEHLANGDYVGLAIARNQVGEAAHTVVPYKAEINTQGKKVLHIWDPNYPFSADSTHYDEASTKKLLVIDGQFAWHYYPDTGDSTGDQKKKFFGQNMLNAWCFAMPMSLVLGKSRQPVALEYGVDVLLGIFTNGLGAAVSQISDDDGHRFYKDVDVDISGREIETDPEKRLENAIRWPWFSSDSGQEGPGELYFIRRHKGDTSPLATTVTGANYSFVACMGKNIIEIDSASKEHSRETIKTYGSVLDALSMDVMTTGKKRKVSLNHLLAGATGKEWRKYRLKNIELPKEVPVSIDMEKEMNAMTISCPEKKVQFDLEIQQRFNDKITLRNVGKVSASPGKMLRLAPKEWKNLEKTELIKDISEKDRSE